MTDQTLKSIDLHTIERRARAMRANYLASFFGRRKR